MEAQVKRSDEKAPLTDPIEIVREYAACQRLEKELEERKKALKPKLNMLIPAEANAKAFRLPEMPGGSYVARRIAQDRRKPDAGRLLRLLAAKNAPPEAYVQAPNEKYVAGMIERGEITLAEFGATMLGSHVTYVTLTWKDEKPEGADALPSK